MTNIELENRIHILEAQVEALRTVLLSIPALLRETEPSDLQIATLMSVQLEVDAEMPLPDEIGATAYQGELRTIASWLREDLEKNPTSNHKN